MVRKEIIPGWLLLTALGLLSMGFSSFIVVGGKQPLEASVIAVLLGLALRNRWGINDTLRPGVKRGETLLVFGIILLGASLNLLELTSQGLAIVVVIVGTMFLGLVSTFLLAKISSLSLPLAILLSVGTTICGGTAVAIVAPLIDAKEEETSYAVATIALWGLVAILLYPEIGHLAQMSEFSFGVFAGTAIHSTPQVVGAGFLFSDEAGRIATAVKLIRNCFIAPVALLIAFWWSKRAIDGTTQGQANVKRAFPWFLFGYFVMAGLNSYGLIPKEINGWCTEGGKFLILLGMAAVGCNTDFGAFRAIGYRPLLVSFAGTAIVAIASASLIYTLL